MDNAGEPFNDGKNEEFGKIGAASDPHFLSSRIGEELDLLDSLAQVIERGRPAFEKRTTVFGRFDAPAVAVDQARADLMLEVRDRSKNGGLSRVQKRGRFTHAAGLHHGDKLSQHRGFVQATRSVSSLLRAAQ